MNIHYLQNNKNLGKPHDDSEWVGKPTIKTITRIEMSCGGGMGGSHWYEYVDQIEITDLDKLVKVHKVENNIDKVINPKYIVSVEDVQLVTCKYEYVQGPCKGKIKTCNFWTELNKEVTCTEEFQWEVFKEFKFDD